MGFKSTVSSKSYRDFSRRTFVSGGGGDSGFSAGQVPPNAPPGTIPIEYLVIGGGGGTSDDGAGGGGGGGFVEGTLDITAGVNYFITIGSGGAAAVGPRGQSQPGGNSEISGTPISTVTAIGGGAGGYYPNAVGSPGGSGGGGATGGPSAENAGGSGYNYPGPTQQGYPGGNSTNPGSNAAGGGGGGAGGSGTPALPGPAAGYPSIPGTTYLGGNGGPGKFSTITGSVVYYSGGGGGGTWSNLVPYGVPGGTGGLGGGGNGGNSGIPNSLNGTTNTGGGAGGGSPSSPPFGSVGGSGIVIIAYPDAFPDLSYIQPTLSYTLLPAPSRPGYKVYKFTSGTNQQIVF